MPLLKTTRVGDKEIKEIYGEKAIGIKKEGGYFGESVL